MIPDHNVRAIDAFLAAVFVVFAFGLFGIVVRDIRDAYSQEATAAEAAQPDGSSLVESPLSLALSQASQG